MTALFDAEGNFEGFEPRACGEHRTVGPHRAWCFTDRCWCYPDDLCPGCQRHLTDEELIALLIQVRDGELTVDEAVRKILEP
jgi:hypothetical protein